MSAISGFSFTSFYCDVAYIESKLPQSHADTLNSIMTT